MRSCLLTVLPTLVISRYPCALGASLAKYWAGASLSQSGGEIICIHTHFLRCVMCSRVRERSALQFEIMQSGKVRYLLPGRVMCMRSFPPKRSRWYLFLVVYADPPLS